MQTLAQLINGQLKGSRSLKISEGLLDFPKEIFELADTLEYLDLSSNKLSKLPDDFGRLRKLKIFFASENLFTSLPEVLSECPDLDIVGFKSNQIEFVPPKALNNNLRWLILTNNRLTDLPKEIGNCISMQKLMLSGNRLTNLPIELSNCKNLTLLRIAANSLTNLPHWLISMPTLSWIAFSGNNIARVKPLRKMPVLDFRSFKVNEKLGEGASGVIYKATDVSDKIAEEVAIKIFKGTVTSDGFPEDEIDASSG
ncbi:MAG: protein kinase, partial [Flavobacterium sp.]